MGVALGAREGSLVGLRVGLRVGELGVAVHEGDVEILENREREERVRERGEMKVSGRMGGC